MAAIPPDQNYTVPIRVEIENLDEIKTLLREALCEVIAESGSEPQLADAIRALIRGEIKNVFTEETKKTAGWAADAILSGLLRPKDK